MIFRIIVREITLRRIAPQKFAGPERKLCKQRKKSSRSEPLRWLLPLVVLHLLSKAVLEENSPQAKVAPLKRSVALVPVAQLPVEVENAEAATAVLALAVLPNAEAATAVLVLAVLPNVDPEAAAKVLADKLVPIISSEDKSFCNLRGDNSLSFETPR